MGKKKKTYVKPEMKIIEVKTEGVIAASDSGGIDVPEDKWLVKYCKESYFKGGGQSEYEQWGGTLPYTPQCHLGALGDYASILNKPIDIDGKLYFNKNDRITLTKYVDEKNVTRVSIVLGWKR